MSHGNLRSSARLGLVLLLVLAMMVIPAMADPVNSSIPDTSVTDAVPVLAGTASAPAVDQDAIHAKTLQLPLSFIENAGQAPDAVKYSVQAEGHTISFTPGKIVLIASDEKDNETVSSQVEMTFTGANTNPTITGLDQLPGSANYFTGSDSSQWHTDVPTYAGIQYTSLYPGIDLKYRGTLGNLKREFVVAPGADPSQIVMEYAGIDSLAISDDGSLKIATALGVLTDEAPVAYQEISGARVPVAVNYRLIGENMAGFVVGEYDHTYPLVIDPWLKYSTFFGAAGGTDYNGMTADASNNIYIIGYTSSADTTYPTKNPFTTYVQGVDAVVTKLSPDGKEILYSTYFGGSSADRGYGIAVDPSGYIYITGTTKSSSKLPVVNATQSALGYSKYNDAFVAKLVPAGNDLVYSTYLGGRNDETGYGITADAEGNTYVVGTTSSTNFPTTNPAQSTFGGGIDAFVAKFSWDGKTRVYSTYLGGGLAEFTSSNPQKISIVADSSGNAYVAGNTQSADFPVTLNAYQSSRNGTYDGYIAEYDPAGTRLYATYFGGSGDDNLDSLITGPDGTLYIAGRTTSTDLPATTIMPGVDTTDYHGYVGRIAINPTTGLLTIRYLTEYGGKDNGGQSIALDPVGNLYVAGSTKFAGFPVLHAVQSANMGSTDGYVFKLNPAGTAMTWSTYLGGPANEYPAGIVTDGSGNVTVAGNTGGIGYVVTGFPVTPDAAYPAMRGAASGFISTISETPDASFTATPTSDKVPLTVSFTGSSVDDVDSWLWDFGDGSTSTSQNPGSHTYSIPGTYSVSLKATSSLLGSHTFVRSNYIQALADKPPVANFTVNKTYGKYPVTIQFNDTSLNYPNCWNWSFGDSTWFNTTDSLFRNVTHTYSSLGTYTVSLYTSNSDGSNILTKPDLITVRETNTTPLSNYRGINIRVANDEGVKYDIPDGVTNYPSTVPYTYVPNTYFVNFGSTSGGLNPLHISTSPSTTSGQLTTTTNQSSTFYLTFTGGQKTMNNGILMLAVNGSIPDDFAVHMRTSGYNWTLSSPSTGNTPDLPSVYNYVDGAVDQTFTKSDFIYGPQTWKPYGSANYPIYYGQDMSNTADTFRIMFIDTRVGALQNTALTDGGMIKVEYSFTNLTSNAVFNDFGWYSNSNHGTGIIMTNDVTTGGTSSSGYTVTPVTTPAVIAPVAAFSANTTTGTAPLAVQFNDTSSNTPTAWAWDFNNDGTIDATTQNATYTYTAAGTYTVNLTATNAAGSNTSLQAGYITVSASAVAPVASFTSDMKTGSAPLTVQFNDTSSGDGITGYQWILGDSATIYTTQNLSHAFTTAGTYSVNHSVTNAAGMNWKNETGYVVVTPRVAKTWTVCQDSSSGCDFVTTNFTEVLKYPSFNDGDTIYLYNGTYSYPTYTTNSRMLTITGEDPSAVIIDMPVSFYFTNTVNISKIYFRSSHDSTYTGFTLSGANSVVRDCIFDSTGRFVITKATNILIENNTVENVGFYAAGIGGTDYKTFRNNSFANLGSV